MIIPLDLGKDSYDIILERGAIKKAGELLGIEKGRKVLVVTDTGVPRIYADTVAWCFEDSYIFIFPEGEKMDIAGLPALPEKFVAESVHICFRGKCAQCADS